MKKTATYYLSQPMIGKPWFFTRCPGCDSRIAWPDEKKNSTKCTKCGESFNLKFVGEKKRRYDEK